MASQQQAGLREHVQYRHRVIYSQFIQGLSQAFDGLLHQDNVSKDMVTHAKALSILKQLYCLRESGCQWQEMEIRQAKMLRHLKLKLTEPKTTQRIPSPNPLPH